MIKEFREKFDKNYFLSVLILAKVRLKKQYQDSFLGWGWSLLQPTIQIIVYTIVFTHIVRFKQPNYIYYLMTGIMPWRFISGSINASCKSLMSKGSALSRCLISRTIFPLTDVLNNFYIFILSFLTMYVFAIVFLVDFNWMILALPLALLPMLISVMAVGIALSFLSPYVRDVVQLLEVGMRAAFYLTPILYPIHVLPEKFKIFMYLNPFYWLIKPIRDVAYEGVFPSFNDWLIIYSIVLMSVVVSFFIYKAARRNIIYYL